MSIETQLREALSARADEVGGLAGDPYERVSGAIAVSRRRRRHAAVAGVAALAAVALAFPLAARVTGPDHTTTPATTRTSGLDLPGPADTAWAQISSWPARGSLAGDPGQVALATRLLDGAHLVFVGDVRDTRLLLGQLPSPEGEEQVDHIVVYAGAAGAPVTALERMSDSFAADPETIVVRRSSAEDGWLLTLSPIGVTKGELSPQIDVTPAGEVQRAWLEMPVVEGVGVADLRGAPFAVTRVRVGSFDGNPSTIARNDSPGAQEPAMCMGCGDTFYATGVDAALSHVATSLGIPVSEVTASTVVTSVLDPAVAKSLGLGTGNAKSTSRVLIVVARTSSGAALRVVAIGTDESGGAGSLMTPEDVIPLDAASADSRPFALYQPTADGLSTVYQVWAPGAASVRLVGDQQDFGLTPKQDLVDGTATFSLAETGISEHRRVQSFDAEGELLGTWPLDPPNLDDPLDVRGP